MDLSFEGGVIMFREGFGLEEKNKEKHIHQLTENFVEIDEKLNHRVVPLQLRIAEDRGNSSETGWKSRLSIQTRLPDYVLGDKLIKRAVFYQVFGLKADGTNTVKGKVRFTYKDGNYAESEEKTTTRADDYDYWQVKMEVNKEKLLDVKPPINAVQNYLMVYSSGGTNYYYAGASFLLIYLT